MTFKEKLTAGPVLFDGAMGTWYAEKYGETLQGCEMANLHHSGRVLAIHREYVAAGCDALKTNTFGANPASLECGWETVFRVLERGWEIALTAANEGDAAVFADIGPVPQTANGDNTDTYRAIVGHFLSLGASNFLFETFSESECLSLLAGEIKSRRPDAFVICSFAVMPDGHTRTGAMGARLFECMSADKNIDAVGFNCVSGPNHMRKFLRTLPKSEKPLSAMPNAGYPTVVGSRTFFGNSAEYFAQELSQIAREGARIVGGCCGSTPDFIKKSRLALNEKIDTPPPDAAQSQKAPPKQLPNRLWSKLEAGKKIVAVELDPPVDSDIRAFMAGAQALTEAGADAITIADCPVSRARADSSLLACKLKRECDIDAIPHMTCRDRNLNATKALLLGLNTEGVNNVLVVTGDPIPSAEREDIKSVYNFNAPMLAAFVRDLKGSLHHGPFKVFAALNINAVNFDAQLSYAKKKTANGVSGFLTQPVHSLQALENLKRARGELDGILLGGIMPIVSYRNACFMNNEISGITVCDDIVTQYRGLNREEASALAVTLSVQAAHDMAAFVNGYYIITPFSRTDLVQEILRQIKPLLRQPNGRLM